MTNQKKAETIKKANEKEWMKLDEVTAVGVGFTSDNKMGVIISVRKNENKIRSLIPAEIEGVPVDIITTGSIRAY